MIMIHRHLQLAAVFEGKAGTNPLEATCLASNSRRSTSVTPHSAIGGIKTELSEQQLLGWPNMQHQINFNAVCPQVKVIK